MHLVLRGQSLDTYIAIIRSDMAVTFGRVRLLGYSGTSLLLAIPALFVSVASGLRLHSPQAHQTATSTTTTAHAVYSHDALTSLPTRRTRTRESKYSPRLNDSFQYSLDDAPLPAHSALRLPKTLFPQGPYSPPLSPGRTPSLAKHSRYHLPFNPPTFSAQNRSPTPSSRQHSVQDSRDSPILEVDRSRHSSYRGPPSPIIFSSPSRAENRPREPTVIEISPSIYPPDYEKDDGSITEVHHNPYGVEVPVEDEVTGSYRWVKGSDRASIAKDMDEYDFADTEEGDEPSSYAFPPYPRIRKSFSGRELSSRFNADEIF